MQFQFLIGRLGTKLLKEGGAEWKNVSIPYRQARYKTSSLTKYQVPLVSIPYRQARYLYRWYSLCGRGYSFNSLQVGQVRCTFENFEVDETKFQFLIGRLGTWENGEVGNMGRSFQFLIGRLGTTFIQLLHPTFIQVSIPYRQARYPGFFRSKL